MLLVTLAKQDVVKCCHVRLVQLNPFHRIIRIQYKSRVVSKGASVPLVPIRILMHKSITDIRPPVCPSTALIIVTSYLTLLTAPNTNVQFAPPPMYATLPAPNLSHQQYYDYNGTFTSASTSTFRPNKRPRNLTEEETAAITRNFSRGDFYVGSSAPVRIDPRLPVRLTLGEGDHVHFTVGEALV